MTRMDQRDQDFVDEEEEGYIAFEKDDLGQFRFGFVHGNMDCHVTTRDGKPAVEFSWEGSDEMDRFLLRGTPCVPRSLAKTGSATNPSF